MHRLLEDAFLLLPKDNFFGLLTVLLLFNLAQIQIAKVGALFNKPKIIR
jgi:hypothetical protein